MAVFNIDVKKQHPLTQESWGNRYFVQASDMTAAISAVPIIVTAEKAFHYQQIDFISALVSTVTPDDGVFASIPQTGTGAKVPGTAFTMPLFLAMVADFLPDGFGPLGRKYYHTGFDESGYDSDFTYDDTLLSDALTALGTMLTDLGANSTPMVKAAGIEYVAVTLKTKVLAHQFTKASKRAITP